MRQNCVRLSRVATLLIFQLIIIPAGFSASPRKFSSPRKPNSQPNSQQLAKDVRAEFLHAWRGYKKYAWGHDDLKPLSKGYHDWYAQPLLMTPVDALDTMILMGLKDEAATTRKYITRNLSFDKDINVQNFEITIRLLGGLLSSYQFTHDKQSLTLAEDLGNRLLPVFNSPTGLPYRFVNLKTGKVRGAETNPAEAGTLLIEFGTLSKLTRRPVFYEKAKRALVEIHKRRSPIGLVGTWINVETGKWTNTDSHISGAIDSYYEYLLKCWLLFDDQDCKRMWLDSIAAINKYLADEFDRQARPYELEAPVWSCGNEYGSADGKHLRCAGCFLSSSTCSLRRPRARSALAGVFPEDVAALRYRAGRNQLPDVASCLARISTAAGDRRVNLLSSSLRQLRIVATAIFAFVYRGVASRRPS